MDGPKFEIAKSVAITVINTLTKQGNLFENLGSNLEHFEFV